MKIYEISTDKNRLNTEMIYRYLSEESYWAAAIPKETFLRSLEHSICFGLYSGDEQIGFARVTSDRATFAYLADVFILEPHRGKGVAGLLIKEVLVHPELQGLRRWLLATRDAHSLYAKFGFTPLAIPDRWMELHNPDVYMTGAPNHKLH